MELLPLVRTPGGGGGVAFLEQGPFWASPHMSPLIEFPIKKTTENSISLVPWRLIFFWESPPLNLIHQRLNNNIKSTPKFPYKFNFDLNEFSMKNLFNVQ
jgi:hypothetical protein